MKYERLIAEIEAVPVTWIPGLLRAIVIQAVKRNVFVDGGIERFVKSSIEKIK
jgi:hypothetical protein